MKAARSCSSGRGRLVKPDGRRRAFGKSSTESARPSSVVATAYLCPRQGSWTGAPGALQDGGRAGTPIGTVEDHQHSRLAHKDDSYAEYRMSHKAGSVTTMTTGFGITAGG